jgi:UMF1 family MFS transporter
MLQRLNPFRGLPNPREVWAWGMYDLANQSFQLLVNTLLFSIYLATYVAPEPAGANGQTRGELWWGPMVALSMLLTVLASPVLGALADARALRKELLIGTGLGAVVLTAALAATGPGLLAVAAAAYVAAAVLVGLGENFLASFLPQLSTPATVGRVSAIGWSMSYLGALILLGLTSLALFVLGADEPREWRWLFVAAAAWFLVGMVPTMFLVAERLPAAPPQERRRLLSATFARLRQTLRQARRYRQLLRFLGVFFVYSMGTMAVVFYAGLIGKRLGFELRQLTLLAVVMALAAGAGSAAAAAFQDRLGHRRTIRLYLTVWVLSTLALALMEMRLPPAADRGAIRAPGAFWLISAGIGLGLGGIGTASRAMVGLFTPPEKSAEFFGLWGMVLKLAGVAGPVAFALTTAAAGHTAGLFLLSGFFAAGLALLRFVDEKAGAAAAHAPGSPADDSLP